MPLVYQDISSALQDDKRRSFHCQGGAEGLPLSFDDPCLHHADSRTAFGKDATVIVPNAFSDLLGWVPGRKGMLL